MNGQRKYEDTKIRGKTGRDKKELVGRKKKREKGEESVVSIMGTMEEQTRQFRTYGRLDYFRKIRANS